MDTKTCKHCQQEFGSSMTSFPVERLDPANASDYCTDWCWARAWSSGKSWDEMDEMVERKKAAMKKGIAKKRLEKNIAIFYMSLDPKAGGDPHYLPNGSTVFIRSEIVQAKNMDAALDLADPFPGESVMNTHEVW